MAPSLSMHGYKKHKADRLQIFQRSTRSHRNLHWIMSASANNTEPGEEDAANPRRCAACKYLRRRCARDCILAPYFPASRPHRYACVHRIFGASNVARLLQNLPVQERGQAADTMAMEAEWGVQDPVYGCTGIINRLQEEIRVVQCELARTRAQLAVILHGAGTAHAPQQAPPPPPPQRAGGHPVVVQRQEQDGQEASSLDPDEFLDLDGF